MAVSSTACSSVRNMTNLYGEYSSIDLRARGQTGLHIIVRKLIDENRYLPITESGIERAIDRDAIVFICSFSPLLSMQDGEGNTILHIAAQDHNLLVYFGKKIDHFNRFHKLTTRILNNMGHSVCWVYRNIHNVKRVGFSDPWNRRVSLAYYEADSRHKQQYPEVEMVERNDSQPLPPIGRPIAAKLSGWDPLIGWKL